MRAKFINETEFKRGKKPVGITSREYQESVMKDLEKKGVKFWFSFNGGEKEYERSLERIDDIQERINLLIEAGVKPTDITVTRSHSMDVKTFQVLNGNHVISECLTEKDAKNLAEIIAKFTPLIKERINFSEGSRYLEWLNMYDDNDPSEMDFIYEIEKNRKKYFGNN